jgi:hypothetical protein
MSASSAAAFVHVPRQDERANTIPLLREVVRYLEESPATSRETWESRARAAIGAVSNRELLRDVLHFELATTAGNAAYQPGASTSRHLVLYNGSEFVLAATISDANVDQAATPLQALDRDTLVAFVDGGTVEARWYRQGDDGNSNRPDPARPLTFVRTETICPGDAMFFEASRDVVDLRSSEPMVFLTLASPAKSDVVWSYHPDTLAPLGSRSANPELLWTRFLIGLAACHGNVDTIVSLGSLAKSDNPLLREKTLGAIATIAGRDSTGTRS